MGAHILFQSKIYLKFDKNEENYKILENMQIKSCIVAMVTCLMIILFCFSKYLVP